MFTAAFCLQFIKENDDDDDDDHMPFQVLVTLTITHTHKHLYEWNHIPQQSCWLLTVDISSEPLGLSQDSYTVNQNDELHIWTLSLEVRSETTKYSPELVKIWQS